MWVRVTDRHTRNAPHLRRAQVRGIPAGGPRGDRTHDPRIKSPLLYQLS